MPRERCGGDVLLFELLADLVVVIHFAFVLFVVTGGLLLFHWRRIIWLHIPAILWGALVEFMHWICPLTYLENWLRGMAGTAVYRGDFITHYVVPILYPAGLSDPIQNLLGAGVIVINATIYGILVWRSRV